MLIILIIILIVQGNLFKKSTDIAFFAVAMSAAFLLVIRDGIELDGTTSDS